MFIQYRSCVYGVMITDAFSHNAGTIQWIGYSWNYALKSALLPHANTQSPAVTECNQSLW